jgi:hypothetical protein
MEKTGKVPSKNFLFGDARIAEFGCFELPGGGAPMTLSLTYARTGASEVTLTAALNGVSRKDLPKSPNGVRAPLLKTIS